MHRIFAFIFPPFLAIQMDIFGIASAYIEKCKLGSFSQTQCHLELKDSFNIKYISQLFVIFGNFDILGEKFILSNILRVVCDRLVQHILYWKSNGLPPG